MVIARRAIITGDGTVTTSETLKRATKLPFKLVAKRHMDPVLRSEWYAQYVRDAKGERHVHYSVFARLFKAVMHEEQVHMRKNKGASGDCIGK